MSFTNYQQPHEGLLTSNTTSSPFTINDVSFSSSTSSPPLFSAPVTIDPLLIDQLAKDFKLEDPYGANLHAFVKISTANGTLSKSDLSTRLYILSALYCDMSERKRATRDQEIVDLKSIIIDLKIRLEATFELTKDQKTNVRKTANDIIYQANRTHFMTMNVDVTKYIRDNATNLGFANIFGNAVREKWLMSHIKTVCLSVRNSFRQEICDGIVNKKTTCTLAQFTYRTAVKFRRGQFEQSMSFGYTIHNAILRRFGLDNLDLVQKACEDDGNESDSAPPTEKKRKHTLVGRVPQGEDFWGRVDQYFAKMVEAHGRDLAGPRWREIVDDIIRRDNNMFDKTSPEYGSSTGITAQGASAFGV